MILRDNAPAIGKPAIMDDLLRLAGIV